MKETYTFLLLAKAYFYTDSITYWEHHASSMKQISILLLTLAAGSSCFRMAERKSHYRTKNHAVFAGFVYKFLCRVVALAARRVEHGKSFRVHVYSRGGGGLHAAAALYCTSIATTCVYNAYITNYIWLVLAAIIVLILHQSRSLQIC